MMKKKIEIRIENRRLRKIRDNLRILLLKAISRESSLILGEQKKILYDEKGNPKKLNPVESKEFRQLQKKLDYLQNLKQNSICLCATCSATDKNMIFNPTMKAWFCTRCYHFNKEFYKYSDPDLYP